MPNGVVNLQRRFILFFKERFFNEPLVKRDMKQKTHGFKPWVLCLERETLNADCRADADEWGSGTIWRLVVLQHIEQHLNIESGVR